MKSFIAEFILKSKLLGLVAAAFMTSVANAGGPLVILANRPVLYRSTAFPLSWRLDPGALGQYNNADAARLVETAFSAWENITTATPSFTRGADFPNDITVSNYTMYWGKFDDGINPVLLDSDGQMLDAIRGAGAKSNVIGLAVSAYFSNGPNAGFYAESEVLINGALSNKTSLQQYLGVIKHELGHLLGLDHAQINKQAGTDGVDANDARVPLMFPISTTNAEFTADDLVAISRLYPADNFFTGRGTLRGTIKRRDGTFVRGANVIASNITNADEQYSTVTDYAGNAAGVFELTGLPPGDYVVAAEPIVTSFNSGSSVGPYAKNLSDLSFLQPLAFEFYNGANESHDHLADDPNKSVTVSVVANGVTENISILANDPPNQILDQYFATNAAFFLAMGTAQTYSATAVRFTPSVNGKLLWIRLFINGGNTAIQGNGALRFAFLKPAATNRDLPGEEIDNFEVPFSALTRGALVPYEIWVGNRNFAVTAGEDFFVSAAVIDNGAVQLLFDDGVTKPTLRTSAKLRNGAWVRNDQAFSKPYNLKMAVAIGGQPQAAGPSQFVLEQNFPNPFPARTTATEAQTVIRFFLPQAAPGDVCLFDALGRQVRVLAKTNFAAGYNVLFWDGRDENAALLSSGIYFYRLRAGNWEEVKKLTLVR